MTEPIKEVGWEDLPPEPVDLQAAVKDYKAWMKDYTKPLDHRFNVVRQRLVHHAISLVQTGEFENYVNKSV